MNSPSPACARLRGTAPGDVTGLEVELDRTCPPVFVSEDAPELKVMIDAVEEVFGFRPGLRRLRSPW